MLRLAILGFLTASCLSAAATADIPDGSSAVISAVPGTGLLRISNDKRTYTLPVARIVGMQDKSNGLTLWFEAAGGIEQRDFILPMPQLLALIKEAQVR